MSESWPVIWPRVSQSPAEKFSRAYFVITLAFFLSPASMCVSVQLTTGRSAASGEFDCYFTSVLPAARRLQRPVRRGPDFASRFWRPLAESAFQPRFQALPPRT